MCDRLVDERLTGCLYTESKGWNLLRDYVKIFFVFNRARYLRPIFN